MYTLLILGIVDRPQYSYIAAYDMDNNRYIIVRYDSGKYILNIFDITGCNLLDRGHFFEIRDKPVFMQQMEGLDLAVYLKDIARPIGDFMSPNNVERLSMIMVDRIEDIIEDSAYHGILFTGDGATYQIKVADDRWLQDWAGRKGLFSRGKDYIIDYMNSDDRRTYLVIYRAHLNRRPYIISTHIV